LILDEPTTGVDAVSRKEFWEMLGKLKKEGISIIVSTPYMDEAALCDRVALMQSGTLMRIDKPEAIVQTFPKKLLAVRSADMYLLMQDLREFDASLSINLFGSKVHIAIDPGLSVQDEIQTYLHKKGHKDVAVEETAAGIEDCFIELMNKTGAHGNRN